ncbi:MAG TPA: Mpo1-like protein [Kofleriaceae bacterium]|nr:Mpo1-like protein [Kofleriaceae bacterium]
MINPKLSRYFEEYSDYHRHPINRLTHKIAIPLIVFHIIAMLNWIPLPFSIGPLSTVAHLVYVAVIAWYLSLNTRLAIIMAVAYWLCFPLAWITPWPVVVLVAVCGWMIQLAGHVVWEKRSPAFTTNLLQALIGPLYFAALFTGDWEAPAQSS